MKSWLTAVEVDARGEDALDARENSEVVGESLYTVERGLGGSEDFARGSLWFNIFWRTRGIENLFRKPGPLPEGSLGDKFKDVDDMDAWANAL
jgi:hypothetical protein